MPPPIALTSLDDRRNRAARDAARRRISWPANLAPETVEFESQGHLLILGSELDARRAAATLIDRLPGIALLVTERSSAEDDPALEQIWQATAALPCHTAANADALRLEGYLGRFLATLALDGESVNLAQATLGRPRFDQVLDLGARPHLTLELPPPGYLAVRWGSAEADQALETLAASVGVFEAPRHVQINADLCAHQRSGLPGCTRCLETCPADALASRQGRVEAWIEVDPHRCHGAGSCASACPTGAIEYRLPHPAPLEGYLAGLLGAYGEAGGEHPVVRFVSEARRRCEATEPAGHVLDIELEELGAAGLDHWLAALAAGAAEVRLQRDAETPPTLQQQLEAQAVQARELLSALGHRPERLAWLPIEDDGSARDALPREAALIARPRAEPAGGKRERLNATLDWLAAQGAPSGESHALPAGAPFGAIEVDTERCTLCQGCVALCPTPALSGGDDTTPRLAFREADCIQCGLCAAGCPEQAIRLAPGFLAAPERCETRVIKEEPAFACIRCGKPFATASTIASIQRKLADHPYFAGEARARLEMCEDCRVQDVWQELARDPERQLKV
ncbi:4Fe-4S dicluster domain-containing protein [Halomonas alkalicola]|uniref:4Fe-4S dicluster domain-containing protein n=1 Tax=Halomonas alkalicola TaxID=1930622 RepID=UPI00265DBAF6|nr:4Fe-4S dicluster domain-containing protein [Halomonas alkalicola]